MLAIEQINLIKRELLFNTSRSGGKGGQNVNKVETKVELIFNICESDGLNEQQKARVMAKLKSKITDEGFLKLKESKSRSQLTNKELVTNRLIDLLNKALEIQKIRKATKPSKSSKVIRTETKRRRSSIKLLRKRPGRND